MSSRIAPMTPVRQKRKSQRKSPMEKQHFAFVAQLPCVITGQSPVEVAHIRTPDMGGFGKAIPGANAKSDFAYVLPLTKAMHDKQGRMGEQKFWAAHGHPMLERPKDSPCAIALALAGYSMIDDLDGAKAYLAAIRDI